MRGFVFLEKHHPMFAECNEEILRVPFFEQRLASAHEIDIFCRRFVRISPRNSGSEKSFCAIRFYNAHPAPGDRMSRIGISRDDFSSRGGVARNLRNQLSR